MMMRTGLVLSNDLRGALSQLFATIDNLNSHLSLDKEITGRHYIAPRLAACVENVHLVSKKPESVQILAEASALRAEPVKHGQFTGRSYLEIAVKYADDWRGYLNLNCERDGAEADLPFDNEVIKRAGDLRASILAVQNGIDNEWLWLATCKEFDRSEQAKQSIPEPLLPQSEESSAPQVPVSVSGTESPPVPPTTTVTYMRLILDTERRTVSHADSDTQAIPLTDPADVAVLAKLFEFGDKYCHRNVLSEAINTIRESDDPKAVEKRVSHVRSVVEPLGYEIINDRKGSWRIAIQSDTTKAVSSKGKHPKRATGKNKATRMKVAGKKSGS
jgi:hypothetical protein